MGLPHQGVLDRSQGWGGRVISLLVLVTLVAGTAYSLVLGPGLRYPDEAEYLQLARNLVAQGRYTLDGVQPTAARGPGYPFLLVPVVALGGSVVAARLLNVAALAASLILLHRLLRRYGFPRAALLAPAITLGYPVVFYTVGTLYPQTIGTTLLLAATLCATATRRPWWGASCAGLAFGLLILAIPTFALKLPLFLLALVLLRRGMTARWRVPLIVALAAALVVGGWTARNAAALGVFVPLATNSGYNLLLGNSAGARPNAGVNIDIERYDAGAAGLGEVARDAYFRQSAVAWITENPAAAAPLYALKVLNYFNYRNQLYVASESSGRNDLLLAATYLPLLLLFAVRLALARRYPLTPLEGALALLYLANPFLDAIATTRIRYRLPFDPLLIAAVAIFLETFYRQHWRAAPQVNDEQRR